jgi:hypothetical protein
VVDTDEHPRATSLEALAKLKGVVRPDGSVTAGNASGVNDGACALLLADEATAAKNGLTPKARVVGMAVAGVAPRIMGMGPAPATQKVLAQTGLTLADLDVIELNEAFAAQGLAVLRSLGLKRRPTSASTPGAVPLPWVTRWVPAVPAWPPPRSTACTTPVAATRCAPCALAWGRALRWCWNAFDATLFTMQVATVSPQSIKRPGQQPRHQLKGRQPTDVALAEVRRLIGRPPAPNGGGEGGTGATC